MKVRGRIPRCQASALERAGSLVAPSLPENCAQNHFQNLDFSVYICVPEAWKGDLLSLGLAKVVDCGTPKVDNSVQALLPE